MSPSQDSVNTTLSSPRTGSRRALAVVSMDVRDTVPLAPGAILGTDEHPFGALYHRISEPDIEEIAAIADPVVRNLRITQGYHDLTKSMTFLVGQRNVSWCAFAIWASRTAGHFIRGDYIPDLVQAYLDQFQPNHRSLHMMRRLLAPLGTDQRWPGAFLASCIRDVANVVSEHLANGNLIVFAEIAPLFARMDAEFRGASKRDEVAFGRFLARIKPGHVSEGGQGLLRVAFRAYYEAMFEENAKCKAELILLANNAIGYHEQTRLQNDIERSLNAPIAAIFLQAARERVRELMHGRLERVSGRLINRALGPIGMWLQKTWALVATRWLMRMEIPGETLLLGRDISHPALPENFPCELLSLKNTELRALLYELDQTPNTPMGSAASNWAELGQRMNFVVDFFRIYQQDQRLFNAPFEEPQIKQIRAGTVPPGDLV